MHRILYHFIAALARLAVRTERSKDLEIIVPRHQLGVLRRQTDRPALNNDDRTLLGAIAAALPRPRRNGWIVTPDTLLRWHRKRVARHWTQEHRPRGRPSTALEVRQLILRFAAENPTLGYRRIHGELTGLGHKLASSTVWRILKINGIEPAPERSSTPKPLSPVASSPSTPPPSNGSTSCSSSTSPPGKSSTPARPPTRPEHGPPKPHATCSLDTPTNSPDHRPWFVIEVANSSARSMRSSEPKDSRSSRPQSGHL
jgi:hypothetical protein